jgi:pimeloyl-ACP methyl ester carboxylesterase
MHHYKILKYLGITKTLICPIIPNISNMYYDNSNQALSSRMFTDNILAFLTKKNIEKIDIVGHSFSTAIMTSIINRDGLIVDRKVYIAPVCFHVGHMKIYKRPYLSLFDIFKKYALSGVLLDNLFSHLFVFLICMCKRCVRDSYG